MFAVGIKLTWARGINGGPAAMSIALLPSRTLRVALASSLLLSGVYPSDCSASWPEDSSTDGDGGPIWTSVSGGGLGKRGEVDDWTPAVAIVEIL